MNKIKNKLRKIAIIQLLIFLILAIYCPFSLADEVSQPQENVLVEHKDDADITILSKHAILMEQENGQILYEYNAREKAYPASTTKLMTAILTLENCNLDDEVVVDSNALLGIPRSYTIASLQPQEKITVDQLMHVLLIPSANDAANVLAFHVAGSIEAFADMMNEKAKEIGCENTHFTNPSGIHDDNHYSTAYDMALIGNYASRFDTIKEIATNTTYSLSPLPTGAARTFKATNTLITPKNQYFYEYATGLKTGYTDKAKSCIVATAKKDDVSLLCVVLGGDKTEDRKAQRELDCKTLFEYGFNNYKYSNLCEENSLVDKSQISELPDSVENVDITYSKTLHLMVPTDSSYTTEYNLNSNINLPIKKGDILGTVIYNFDGNSFKVDLLAASDAYPIGVTSANNLFKVLLIALVLILLIALVKKKNRKRESRYFKRSLY